MTTQLTADSRPIKSVSIFVAGEDMGFEVMESGVTKIEAYDEAGEMAMVPWIAIYEDEMIICRIPGREISKINYR